jgi:hypothetical protein
MVPLNFKPVYFESTGEQAPANHHGIQYGTTGNRSQTGTNDHAKAIFGRATRSRVPCPPPSRQTFMAVEPMSASSPHGPGPEHLFQSVSSDLAAGMSLLRRMR